MKTINVREARMKLAELMDEAQREPILVTKHGRPLVLITGVDGADLGSVILEGSKKFWEEIERRRASTRPRVTHEELVAKYGLDGKRPKKAEPRRRKAG
jgi:prevent-host-death family protein